MPAMSPEEIVRSFCEAVARRDVQELVGFFSADAVYHNIPVEPVSGQEAIGKVLSQYLGPASRAEFELLALAVSGRTVLTERVDRFTIGDKPVELPVMGAFEVDRDGRISAWRDYFDMGQFTGQLA
jgi:limonene-1,2-epoxide hydrolase